MKLILLDRLSFWKVLSAGKKTVEVGTMRKLPDETQAKAMPRALEVAKAYYEEHKDEHHG
jgi:hypothetical protein